MGQEAQASEISLVASLSCLKLPWKLDAGGGGGGGGGSGGPGQPQRPANVSTRDLDSVSCAGFLAQQ